MSWPWSSHSSDPSPRRPIKKTWNRKLVASAHKKGPWHLPLTVTNPFSETPKTHLPSSKISKKNDKSRSSTGVAFAPLVFFLALGLVLDAWLKPVLETTLDVPGLLASLTSGAARPKGLCSAFDGSRMISIRLTHIYLSILNIYSYSYIYIYLSIYLSPPLTLEYIYIYIY